MKKIMITLTIMALAVASQAATASWKSGTLYVPGTDTKLAGTYGANAALISLTKAQYDAIVDDLATKSITSADGISTYLYNTYKDSKATKTGSFMTGASTLADTASYAKGDTAYGVVIYTTYDNKDKTGDLYYIANYGALEFTADANASASNMGVKIGGIDSGAALSWQTAAVPEPTSGLLLLLGMAGLALRRRRA